MAEEFRATEREHGGHNKLAVADECQILEKVEGVRIGTQISIEASKNNRHINTES